MVPVQSVLTVYVPVSRSKRVIFPLRLNETTVLKWPLPFTRLYPAAANGPLNFPPMLNPLVANRYVPRSVASEHCAAASGAAAVSAASALPAPARANGNDKASAPTWFLMSPPRMLASSPKKDKEIYDG